MDWPYFNLRHDGKLVDEDGNVMGDWPKFSSVSAAESWLEENDIRGSVRC